MQTSQTITYSSLFQYITNLVEKLPLRRREMFIKSRFEGLSIREIAEELKISHKTVENQLTEALKFIRTNLNKEYIPAVLFFYAVCFLILSELFRIFDCRIVLFKKNGLSTAISGHLARCQANAVFRCGCLSKTGLMKIPGQL